MMRSVKSLLRGRPALAPLALALMACPADRGVASAPSWSGCGQVRTDTAAVLKNLGGTAIAVGVVHGGAPVCVVALGTLWRGGPAAGGDTVFHMASVSKVFVATAVMKLVEAGRVDLDAPVTRYLPNFRLADSRYRQITVRQLLTHTSGLGDVSDYGWSRPAYDEGALARYVASLRTSRLRSRPGTRFYYSNIGFEVLGAVVARVSGVPFEEFMQKSVLAPAGMRSATFILPRDRSRYAAPYVPSPTGGTLRARHYPYNRAHAPSSTLHAGVNDMVRWIVAVLPDQSGGNRLLGPTAWQAMSTPLRRDIIADRPGEGPRGLKIGLSWFLLDHDGRRLMLHPGEDDGFRSLLILDPSTGTGVTVMINSSADVSVPGATDGLSALLALRLAEAVLDKFAAQGLSR